jgi:hypothetical protein
MQLPNYRLLVETGVEKVLWAFEDNTLPVRENITIDAALCTFPLAKGQVMGKVTLTGLFGPYDNGASDGREVAYGVLDEELAADMVSATPQNITGIVGVMGTAYESACVGLDAAAKVDMPQIKFE